MAGGLQAPAQEEEEQQAQSSNQGVVFVLEDAQLEAAMVGKTYQLLNCDDHKNFIMKHKKDPATYRPDICHQAIYVRTHKNVLIQVNPHIRLPRTFKRFCGLMVQLLQKLSIRATNGPDKLLKVIKGPVTKHFPLNSHRVGFSHSAQGVVPFQQHVQGLDDKTPVVLVVGAFAHGKIDAPWVDEAVSISQYPLSAAYVLSRITNAFEQKWQIV